VAAEGLRAQAVGEGKRQMEKEVAATTIARMAEAQAVNVSDPSQSPSCAQTGVGWNDPARNTTPTGLYQPNALECQKLCQHTVYCDRFTYYTDSSGCWLQGNQGLTSIESKYIIAGPMNCTTGLAPLVPASPASEADAATADASSEGSGGGIPAWLVVIIILLLLCCIGGIVYYMCSGSEGKKKKKSKKNKDLEAAGSEANVVTEPLMTASAVAPPVVASAAAPVVYTSGSPVAATSMTQMAMPVTSYSVVSPVQQLVVPQGAQDQFAAMDVNGDGVLSREEIQAGMASQPAPQ